METTTAICERCQELETKVASLQSDLTRTRELLARAQKTSATSSKPPSSDIVKAKRVLPSDGRPRPIGGQPGHPLHQRPAFAAEMVTHAVVYELQTCPDCGGELQPTAAAPRVVQQVDMPAPALTITQHTQPEYWCAHCRHVRRAALATGVARGGLIGPHLTTLIAFMKGVCHASFSTIRTFLRDVVGVTVARSTLVNTIKKVSAALDEPYEELRLQLPTEAVLNVDETGHKCNKELWWTWCLRADLYTVFAIDAHRSADVLLAVLGREFTGTLGCDYFSAYRKYMRVCGVTVQFCLAHLIRDVKFLTTLPDAATKDYGERVRAALKELFAIFHQRETLAPAAFARQLQAARDRVLQAGLDDVPKTRLATNLAKRFRQHGAAFFTFVTTPDVEPTNNLAEQAIRFVVIDRLITQGTRSEAGRRWSERIWTAIATCAAQGRSVHAYLHDCMENWFVGLPSPSLLPGLATGDSS